MKRSLFIIGAGMAMLLGLCTHTAAQNVLYIDKMGKMGKNDLAGKNAIYVQAPSKVSFSKSANYGREAGNPALRIIYDKRNEGGANGDGGFCSFYTKLAASGNFNASSYKYVIFRIKGKTGTEKFKLGAQDQTWKASNDSFKSQEIGNYLPGGKITTSWQMAVIPMEEFYIDWGSLVALYICFEADVFSNGADKGTVYIDDIALVKELSSIPE